MLISVMSKLGVMATRRKEPRKEPDFLLPSRPSGASFRIHTATCRKQNAKILFLIYCSVPQHGGFVGVAPPPTPKRANTQRIS